MQITKYGHACLLIEEEGAKILIDPGIFNATPDVEGLDAILITHEHQDHCDVSQIQQILAKNPGAIIYTHEGAGKTLGEADIPYMLIEHGQTVMVKGVPVTSCGTEHAVIYKSMPCQNTGFMIADKFFFPGDSFVLPERKVEILALPAGGPWMKLAEAIDYTKKVKPKYIIPVHDAMHIPAYRTGVVQRFLSNIPDVVYQHMDEGSVEEF